MIKAGSSVCPQNDQVCLIFFSNCQYLILGSANPCIFRDLQIIAILLLYPTKQIFTGLFPYFHDLRYHKGRFAKQRIRKIRCADRNIINMNKSYF